MITLLAAVVLAWPVEAPAAVPPARPRLDRHGDPLPPGAIARLGTIRWRHRDGFHQSVLSPDGRWLVSSAQVGMHDFEWRGLLLWDCSSGRLVHTLESPAFREGWPFVLYAFLPGGKRLLSLGGGSGDTLFLWEFPSFRLLKRWKGVPFSSLVVSSDGALAAGPVSEWKGAPLPGQGGSMFTSSTCARAGLAASGRPGKRR
jgi:hypothetical protein